MTPSKNPAGRAGRWTDEQVIRWVNEVQSHPSAFEVDCFHLLGWPIPDAIPVEFQEDVANYAAYAALRAIGEGE